MDPEKEHKKYAPKFEKMLKRFVDTYPERLYNLRVAADQHNVNFTEKLTHRDVGTIAGMPFQNYGQIERGTNGGGNTMTIQHAIKLSVIFGCSLDYLIFGRDSGDTDNAEDKQLIRKLEDLLEAERELSAGYLKQLRKLQKRMD